jgi:hypothetical protein
LAQTHAWSLLEWSPRVARDKIRIRGISDEVPLGIEPLRILEEIFPTHGGAVVNKNREGIRGPFFAVCEDSLVWLAAPETDPGRRPQAEGFFNDGEGVGQVVDEVGVATKDICGDGGLSAKEGLVLFSESVEDLGMLA